MLEAAWAEHREACARAEQDLARLERASEASPPLCRGAVTELARSSDLKRRAAFVVLDRRRRKRMSRTGRPAAPLDIREVAALAEDIDVRSCSGEAVRITSLPKPDGGVRPIVSFDVKDHARQTVVRLIMEANVAGFDIGYGDVHDALDTIALGVAAGFTHAVVFDVRNAYSTLKSAALPKVCAVTSEMAAATIAAPRPDDPRVRWSGSREAREAVRSKLYPRRYLGIVQGSAASPVAARALMSAWFAAAGLDPATPVILYADDGVLLARSRSEAEALRARLEAHAGGFVKYGRLGFGRCDVHDLRDGIDFLGARIVGRDGQALVTASAEGLARFVARSAERLASPGALRQLALYHWNWTNQRSFWVGAGSFANALSVHARLARAVRTDDPLEALGRIAEELRRVRPCETRFVAHERRPMKEALLRSAGRIPTPDIIRRAERATQGTA